MPYLPPQSHTADEVTGWVRDVVLHDCRTWVATRGTRIVGYAALQGEVLDQLYLRPDVLRQGVGTRLLETVKRHSPTGVTLHVFARNTGARAFYARHGFTVLAEGDGSGTMEGLPDMTLCWRPGDTR